MGFGFHVEHAFQIGYRNATHATISMKRIGASVNAINVERHTTLRLVDEIESSF